MPPFFRIACVLGNLITSGFRHIFQETTPFGAERFTERPQIDTDQIRKPAIVLGIIAGLFLHPFGITVFSDRGQKICVGCLAVRQSAALVQYPAIEIIGTLAAVIRKLCGIDARED